MRVYGEDARQFTELATKPVPQPVQTFTWPSFGKAVLAVLGKISRSLDHSHSHEVSYQAIGEDLLREAIKQHQTLLDEAEKREVKNVEDDDRPMMKIKLRGGGEVSGHYNDAREEDGKILWVVIHNPADDSWSRIPPDVVAVTVVFRSGRHAQAPDWRRD